MWIYKGVLKLSILSTETVYFGQAIDEGQELKFVNKKRGLFELVFVSGDWWYRWLIARLP